MRPRLWVRLTSIFSGFPLLNLFLHGSSDDHEISLEPPEPTCTDLFRIVRPEPWAVKKGNWGIFSSEPKLCFQLKQFPSRNGDSIVQIYNIWSPAYFGTSLLQPSSQPYELRYNDLIVTTDDNDTERSKANFSSAAQISPISFQMEKIVGRY